MILKRKFLSVAEKIEILNAYEEEKLSCRALTEKFKVKFGIGKTQVAEIINNAEEIRTLWTSNGNEGRKRMKMRKTSLLAVNETVHHLFCSVRAKNLPVSGPLLQAKAREVSQSLKITHFKASNGWLEKFRLRYNISFKRVVGRVVM